MLPTAYSELSDSDLMALCLWREARGEERMGKRGVAHVIINRQQFPSEFGHSIRSIILRPFAFSSFNENDPNHIKFPSDANPSWIDCLSVCGDVLSPEGDTDITNGAVMYHDTSIQMPTAWANEFDPTPTLQVGRLRFYRKIIPI